MRDTSKQEIVLCLEEKTVVLSFNNFDSDIDIDEVLKIQHHNILGEVYTIPVLVNQIGLLRASHEEKVKEFKFDLDIYRAQTAEHQRKVLAAFHDKVTVQQVENAVNLDQGVQLKTKTLFRLEKELAYLEALYVAVKSKDQKLNSISRSLTPADMENRLVEAAINNTYIKVLKNTF